MRNPNGFGSVYKLSGKRRRPWAARVTVGFKMIPDRKTAYPVYKFIGYYPTKVEAFRALSNYTGEEPLTTIPKITLLEVYQEWSKEHSGKVSSFKQYDSGFQTWKPLFNKPLEDLTISNYEEAAKSSPKSLNVMKKGKTALRMIYKYAFRQGIIDESKLSIPEYIVFTKENKRQHIHRSLTANEIQTLWDNKNEPTVDIILFMIYTGVRLSELYSIEKENVTLRDPDRGFCSYFKIKKSKTEAGKRTVPISDKILYIVDSWMSLKGPRLVPMVTVHAFRRDYFEPTCEKILGQAHLPHDTRYTTATLLAEAAIDERYIKMILGHAFTDVTNAVYSKRIKIEVLAEAINQI